MGIKLDFKEVSCKIVQHSGLKLPSCTEHSKLISAYSWKQYSNFSHLYLVALHTNLSISRWFKRNTCDVMFQNQNSNHHDKKHSGSRFDPKQESIICVQKRKIITNKGLQYNISYHVISHNEFHSICP